MRSEGWLSAYSLDIAGWVSGNPDERIALRKAIKKVIIGNLPVFDQHAMVMCQLTMADVEDFETFSAPMYQSIGTFSCVAPSIVAQTGIPPIPAIPAMTASVTLLL